MEHLLENTTQPYTLTGGVDTRKFPSTKGANGRGEPYHAHDLQTRNDRVTKLVRRQSIQQFIGVELDELSILNHEHVLALQQRVNGFTGANEI